MAKSFPSSGTGIGAGNYRVVSAPLAVIKIGGTAIGKMRDISFTETYNRTEVKELGNLYTVEVPLISFQGSFQASSSLISFKRFGTVEDVFWPSGFTDPKAFANAILLGEWGIALEFYVLELDGAIISTDYNDDNFGGNGGKIKETLIGKASNVFIESCTTQISVDSVGTKNITGRFLTPLLLTGATSDVSPIPAVSSWSNLANNGSGGTGTTTGS